MTNTTTTTEIKGVPANRVATIRKEVAKAQARIERAALKAGQFAPTAPTLVVGEMYIMSVDDEEAPGGKRKWRAVDITVTYARPKLDGWEFLAVVEPLTGGNLLRAVPGAEIADGELDAWRTSDLRCDHCGTVRRRSETFVLRTKTYENVDCVEINGTMVNAGTVTVTYKQVGRNCLSHFLGGKSAASIISALAWPALITGCAEEGGMGGGSREQVYTSTEILVQTAACVRVGGWVSKTVARDREMQATADLVLFILGPKPTHPEGAQEWRAQTEKCKITDEDTARGEAALAWAVNLPCASDYERNLQLVASQEVIERSHVGILASAIAGYNRFLGIVAERSARPTSKHVGEVGKRLDLEVTIERAITIDTQYGALVINSMRTDDGAIIVWKTGKSVGTVGNKVSLRGTVKKHTEYKGEAQTEMSRCSVSDPSNSQGASK